MLINPYQFKTKAPVTSGLILYLDAGNTASYSGFGTTWTDLSGSNNNGTITSGITYNSENSGSLVFPGSNNVNVRSFSNQISPTGSRTICIFAKVTTVSRAGLCGNRDGGNGFVFTVNRTTTGNLTYFHTGGSLVETTASITQNQWFHATVTYNVSLSTANLYVNGNLLASQNGFSAMAPPSSNGIIGDEDTSYGTPFKGNIAQCLIYNQALTTTQVQQNFNAFRDRFGI